MLLFKLVLQFKLTSFLRDLFVLFTLLNCLNCLIKLVKNFLKKEKKKTLRARAHFGGLRSVGTALTVRNRHFWLWETSCEQGVFRQFEKFDIFAWLYTTVRFAFRHKPFIRLGSMEQEAEESGTKISNVAVDSESYVNDALPEVRLGMSAINQCLFVIVICCQNYKKKKKHQSTV